MTTVSSTYFQKNEKVLKKKSGREYKSLPVLLSFFLIFTFFSMTITPLFDNISVAYADEEKTEDEILREAAEEAGYTETNDEGLEEAFLDVDTKYKNKSLDRNTFPAILYRAFFSDYMNYTPNAFNPETGSLIKDEENGDKKSWNCDVKDKRNGTPMYHNCDIPTFGKEMLQSLISIFLPTGITDASITTAKAGLGGLGVPPTLPKSSNGEEVVPVASSERAEKYTALELFGYDMKYTFYRGEWDNIRINNGVRTLRNFATSDGFKMALQTTRQAFTDGADAALVTTGKLIEEKGWGIVLDPIGTVRAIRDSFVEATVSSAANTIMDSAEYNIFNNYGWYRTGYGNTLYNAREITPEEKAVLIQMMLLKIYDVDAADLEAKLSDEFLGLESGPPRPVRPIPKCSYNKLGDTPNEEGIYPVLESTEVKADSKPQNGTACRDAVVEAYKDDPDLDQSKQGFYTFDPAGTTANDYDLEAWLEKEDVKDFMTKATANGFSCVMSTATSNSLEVWDENVKSFYDCWNLDYTSTKATKITTAQEEISQEWVDERTESSEVVKIMDENPEYNFNAPWNQYICVDEKGNDIITEHGSKADLKRTFLYDTKGNLNSKCKIVRSPIQNGYFGNGYESKGDVLTDYKSSPNGVPGIDTRWKQLGDRDLFSLIFDPTKSSISPVTLGNTFLGLTGSVTQIANEFIGLSFAPILKHLGLDTVLVIFMESFIDSIYMPFVVTVIALSAIWVFITSVRRLELFQAIKSLLVMTLIFVVGIMFLYNPQRAFNLVDEIPSKLEGVILSIVFGDGGDTTNVCKVTAPPDGSESVDDEGFVVFNTDHTVRALQCQIWKALLFTPWVQGQWGTSYENLYSAESNVGTKKMKNTNAELVGDASVNMGGSVTEKNWALYQMDLMKSGTITTKDPNEKYGTVDKNFYKLVDMQAGQAGGIPLSDGTKGMHDGTYFEHWAGAAGMKNMNGFIAFIVSLFAAATIIAYAIMKIQVTILSLFLIVALPLMLLVGLHPSGKLKLKTYMGALIGLMAQRVVIVFLMAVMLRVMTTFAEAATTSLMTYIFVSIICWLFFVYRRELIEMILGKNANGEMKAVAATKNAIKATAQRSPKFIRQSIDENRSKLQGYIGGAAAGLIAEGTFADAHRYGTESAKIQGSRAIRSQYRKEGRTAFAQVRELREENEKALNRALEKDDSKMSKAMRAGKKRLEEQEEDFKEMIQESLKPQNETPEPEENNNDTESQDENVNREIKVNDSGVGNNEDQEVNAGTQTLKKKENKKNKPKALKVRAGKRLKRFDEMGIPTRKKFNKYVNRKQNYDRLKEVEDKKYADFARQFNNKYGVDNILKLEKTIQSGNQNVDQEDLNIYKLYEKEKEDFTKAFQQTKDYRKLAEDKEKMEEAKLQVYEDDSAFTDDETLQQEVMAPTEDPARQTKYSIEGLKTVDDIKIPKVERDKAIWIAQKQAEKAGRDIATLQERDYKQAYMNNFLERQRLKDRGKTPLTSLDREWKSMGNDEASAVAGREIRNIGRSAGEKLNASVKNIITKLQEESDSFMDEDIENSRENSEFDYSVLEDLDELPEVDLEEGK